MNTPVGQDAVAALASGPSPASNLSNLLDLFQARTVLETMAVAVYTTDAEGRITFYNQAAADLWGCRPEIGKSEFCGSWKLHWPDGRPLPHDQCPMAIALKERRPIRDTEAVAERPDGVRVPFMPFPTPLYDRLGNLVGAVNILVDISGRKQLEDTLARKANEQAAMHRFTDRLFHAQAPEQIYDAGLQVIVDVLGAQRASILLFDETGIMRFAASRELSVAYRNAVEGHSPWQASDRDAKPMVIPDVESAPELGKLQAIVRKEGIRAVAFIPLMVRRSVIGKFMAYFDTPRALDDKQITLAVHIARQLGFAIAQIRAEDQRRRAEIESQLLAAVVSSSDDAILTKDLGGIITSWNWGAQRIFGYSADEIIGRPVTVLFPPDRIEEEAQILARLRRGERVDHYETIRRHKDGRLLDVSLTISPIKDENGKVVGASKIARDVSERRKNDEQQKLLLREMDHRVKNLFTLVGGIVNLSTRSAHSAEALGASISARIGALARAHALTLAPLNLHEAGSQQPTSMHALIRTILSPYEKERGDDGIVIDGPDISVGPKATTALALIFNELATNAAKYGSLSVPAGCVRVECAHKESEVLLTWSETGGPLLSGTDSARGFGSILAESTVTRQLEGKLERQWLPEGLVVAVTLPGERLER